MNVKLFLTFLILWFMTDSSTLYDFKKSGSLKNWFIVNDGVMGGRSNGQFGINQAGHGEFKGAVSLDNNGGFTSVRYIFERMEVSTYSKIVLKVKGDGKRYQFRAKPNRWDRHAYIQYFETSQEWEEVEIDLLAMYPTFRGRKLRMPNFPGKYMEEITLMIANKKAENFKLEIDHIGFR